MPTLQKPMVHRGCGHSLLHTRHSYHRPKAPADLPFPSVLTVGAVVTHRRAAVQPMPVAGATWGSLGAELHTSPGGTLQAARYRRATSSEAGCVP